MTGSSMIRALAALLCTAVAALSHADAPTPLAREMAVLAEEGLRGTPEGLKAAERAYEKARRLAPDDAGIEYAWSLVLTKNRKFEQAEESFQKALAASPPYLPARVASIRNKLRQRKLTEAAEQLVDLAELIGHAPAEAIPVEDRRQAAVWMGSFVEYLKGPAGDADVAQFVNRRIPSVSSYLEEYRDQLASGQTAVGRVQRQFQDQLQTVLDESSTAKTEAMRREVENKDKLERDYRNALKDQASAKKLVEEGAADLDAKLGALEKQLTSIQETERKLSDAILNLSYEMSALQRDLERLQRYEGYPAAKQIYADKINEKTAERELLRADLMSLYATHDQATRRAQQLLEQRSTVYGYQNQLANKSIRVSAQYERLQKLARTQLKEIQTSAPSSSGRAQALRNKMQSWSTYDSLDASAELSALAGGGLPAVKQP